MRKFERLRHVRYFANSLRNLPKQYSGADTNRLTLVHFCVQALDILGCLPENAGCCGEVEREIYIPREAIVEWIYGLQTLPTSGINSEQDEENEGPGNCCAGGGFKGSTYLGPLPKDSDQTEEEEEDARQQQQCQQQSSTEQQQHHEQEHPYDHSHLAMTYVALCTLAALGDDLARINKTAILQTVASLQKEDGSFVAISLKADSSEDVSEADDDCDLRFMYAGIVIWYLLKNNPTSNDNDYVQKDGQDNQCDEPIINVQSATNYILSCISYDGGLGLTPGREGHGGSTFCGIASLYLMGVLDEVMAREELLGWKEDLIRWCVTKQYSLCQSQRKSGEKGGGGGVQNNGYSEAADNTTAAGMQGRPNKLEDTCYSYWIGGTLHLLNESHLLDGWALREYVLTCQSPYGGFGKVVGAMPDVLHSFYSLAWLALSEEQRCCEEDCEDAEGEGSEKVGYDSDVRQQVVESIGQLSKLECALGICAKRKPAFQMLGMNGNE